MDIIDIRLKYKSETGKYPIRNEDESVLKGLFYSDLPITDIVDYVIWLEENLVNCKNK